MSVFTNRGKAAKDSLNHSSTNIDFKKVFIRLKDGDSVRVRLLSPEDYVEYMAHGDYAHGIFTQACSKSERGECALCEANAAKVEGFDGLYAKKRYLFAFADVDSGEVRAWDASKGQAQGLIDTIEQYAEDLDDVAFTLKRTGTKTNTSYSLNPILKLKADDKERFHKFDGEKVADEFFNAVLMTKSREKMLEDLAKAGFPVDLMEGGQKVKAGGDSIQDDAKEIPTSDVDEPAF